MVAWGVVGFPFPVLATRKKIGFGVETGGPVPDGVFVVINFGGPPGLARGKSARGLEVLEGLVIGIDGERLLAGFEVHVPLANCLDDCQHFRVSYSVVELGRGEFSREEGNRVLIFGCVSLSLRQDSGDGVSRRIGLDQSR